MIRGEKVIFDRDLAKLYGVSIKVFNQAVRRNQERFPPDFMFQISRPEAAILRSQTVIAFKRSARFQPLAFTASGVAMLSVLLRNERAVEKSLGIIRSFVRMRELIAAHKDIAARLEKSERGHDRTGSLIEELIEDIHRLAQEVKDLKSFPRATNTA